MISTWACSFKYPTRECLTLGLSHSMNGVTLAIVTMKTIRPQLPRSFSIKLHSKIQDSDRLRISEGKSYILFVIHLADTCTYISGMYSSL